MPTTINSYASLTNEQKTFYDRALLKRLLPNLLFLKHGQKRDIPKHEGDTIDFRRFNSLPVPEASLTEGVTPDAATLDVAKVTATVAQEGNYVIVTDKLDMVGIDPVITESAALMGENAAETLETRCAAVIFNGTNVQNAAGTLTSSEIKKAVRTLKKANAKPMADGYFYAFVDPDTAFDLQNDTLWQDVSKYNGGENIEKGELGKLHGVKFFETTMCPVFEADDDGEDKHRTLIIGRDAYGVTSVEGESQPRVIVKPAGSAGSEDPLEQRATVAWKGMFTAVRLNEDAMCCIYHDVTA